MAIRPVEDFGGLGRLADTILRKRALDQQAIDKERAFGLQEAAGARAESLAELNLRIGEGQLTAQELAATRAAQQAETGRSLADLVAGITPADQVGPPIPRDITIQRGAELTSQPGGGGVDRLTKFGEQLDVLRPPASQALTFATDEKIRLAKAKSKLDALAAEGSAAIKTLKDQQANEADIKKATTKQTNVLRARIDTAKKSFEKVNEAFKRIERVGKAETPAGDLALIFNFMKMLDPGSVVRESEFRTAEQAKAWLVRAEEGDIPVPAPIANAIRRASKGTLLEASQRIDFVTQAGDLFRAQSEATDGAVENILSQGVQDGIDATSILGEKAREELRSRSEERATLASAGREIATQGQRLPSGVSAEDFATLQAENPDMTAEELIQALEAE